MGKRPFKIGQRVYVAYNKLTKFYCKPCVVIDIRPGLLNSESDYRVVFLDDPQPRWFSDWALVPWKPGAAPLSTGAAADCENQTTRTQKE